MSLFLSISVTHSCTILIYFFLHATTTLWEFKGDGGGGVELWSDGHRWMTFTTQQALLLCLYLQVYFDTLDLEAEKPNYRPSCIHTHSLTHWHAEVKAQSWNPIQSCPANRCLAGCIHAGMSGIVSKFLQEKQNPRVKILILMTCKKQVDLMKKKNTDAMKGCTWRERQRCWHTGKQMDKKVENIQKNRFQGLQAGRKTNIKSRQAVVKLLPKISNCLSFPSDRNLMLFLIP